MKTTGIVRRIDDLGRIVIPKETRKVLRWRNQEAIEVFVDKNDCVILKKYSPDGDFTNLAKSVAESIYQSCGCKAMVTDRENIIAVAGCPEFLLNTAIDHKLVELMELRKCAIYSAGEPNFSKITYNIDIDAKQICVSPILCHGDIFGSVVISTCDEKTALNSSHIQQIALCASIIGKYCQV